MGSNETFWHPFLALTNTGPDLLTTVCRHLSNADRQSLHSVSQAMRLSMNATVTAIRCSQHNLPTHQQLHAVFPNATSLTMPVGMEHGDPRFRVDGWRFYLQQLASSSEPLLKRLRHLSLTIPAEVTGARDLQPVVELLTR
jgi:hypothetical protein